MDRMFANLKKANIEKFTKIDAFDKSEQSTLKNILFTHQDNTVYPADT